MSAQDTKAGPTEEELALAAAEAENARLRAQLEARPPTASSEQLEEDWTTWSDAELMGRLLRRGSEATAAKALVRDRVMASAVEEIEEILALEFLDDNDKPVRLESTLDRRNRR